MISFRAILWLLCAIPFLALLSFFALIITAVTWNPMLSADLLKPIFSKVMLWVLGIRLKVHGKNHLHQFNSISRHIPNFFSVLTNGTIRREPTHIGRIQHSLSLPCLLIVPQRIHFTLSTPICLEISRHQEMI